MPTLSDQKNALTTRAATIEFDSSQLRYEFFYTQNVSSIFFNSYLKLYQFWRDSWTYAFEQIGSKMEVTAAEFSRHPYATGLFYKDNCVGCALLGEFQLLNPVHALHPYFKFHPSIVMEKLRYLSGENSVLTFGYLAIDSNFRGKFGFSDILLGLALLYLKQSNSRFMISHTRNTRKTNELTYRLGAQSLATNLEMHGEPSDFVYFDRENQMALKSSLYSKEIESLWNSSSYKLDLNPSKHFSLKGKTKNERTIQHDL